MHVKTRGFTLVEIVTVLSVVMVLALAVSVVFPGAKEGAARSVALHEMQQIREAVLQFRRDTGYFPKQGPFAPWYRGGHVPFDSRGKDWLEHPANLVQLFENPLAGTQHPLAAWNPDTGRGWRGPYLNNRVDVLVESARPSSRTRVSAHGRSLLRVPAVVDSFSPQHRKAGSGPDARSGSIDGGDHPYLLLDLDQAAAARVVCTGPNGRYDRGGDDLVLPVGI
jgi:type II secretory pathway pseudopilin PulG